MGDGMSEPHRMRSLGSRLLSRASTFMCHAERSEPSQLNGRLISGNRDPSLPLSTTISLCRCTQNHESDWSLDERAGCDAATAEEANDEPATRCSPRQRRRGLATPAAEPAP